MRATPDSATNGEAELEHGLVLATAVFRWLALAWMLIVLVVSREDIDRPVLAGILTVAALAVTVSQTVLGRRNEIARIRRFTVAVELPTGLALLAVDGIVYGVDQSNSFGSAWPLAGVLLTGGLLGRRAGALAGLAMGVARLVSEWTGDGLSGIWLSVVSTAVLYTMAGWAAGELYRRLRVAERRISAARAREEVARTLHDGVLQTLAVVQRRSDDGELVALARQQEHELRQYLLDGNSTPRTLAAGLHAAANRAESIHGLQVNVVVADDLPELSSSLRTALTGAVGECLTNAVKHGGADRVTIYAEPADGDEVYCSVKDNGSGFDPESIVEGTGLTRSIRGRVADVGGRVELSGRPGRGGAVQLWVPVRHPNAGTTRG